MNRSTHPKVVIDEGRKVAFDQCMKEVDYVRGRLGFEEEGEQASLEWANTKHYARGGQVSPCTLLRVRCSSAWYSLWGTAQKVEARGGGGRQMGASECDIRYGK